MNLDNLMIINDGFLLNNSLRMSSSGLSFEPTIYNIKGSSIKNDIEYSKYHLIYKNKIIDGVSASIPKEFDKNISNMITPNFTKDKKVFTIRLKKNPDKILLSIIEGTLKNYEGKVILTSDKKQNFTTLFFKDENDVNKENIIKLVKKFNNKEIPILGMNDVKLFL